jgi:hypothetical protein
MKGITASRLAKPLIGLAMIAGLSVGQVANAAMMDVQDTSPVADKTFNLWGLEWTAQFGSFGGTPSDGTVSYNNACPNAADCPDPTVGAKITGDNSGSGDPTATEMMAFAPSVGTISFDWTYQTTDTGPAPPEPTDPLNRDADPFFLLKDNSTSIFDLNASFGTCDALGLCTGSLAPLSVAMGLFSFGLSIDSVTGENGSAWVEISNFEFLDESGRPIGAVPVPAAFWLFGTALAGLGFMRKKKAAV